MLIPPPPALDQLPAGTQLVAGLGVATVVADIDFETRSEAGFEWDDANGRWTGPPGAPANSKGLPVVGAAAYTAHPTCDVLCCAYDLKDGRGKRWWRPGLPPPADLFDHVAARRPLEAWNVGFERWVWEHVCTPRYGWPPVDPDTWRCAMAKARAHALPGKLEKTGEVLGLETQKDSGGKRLLDKFSVPQRPTKADSRVWHSPVWTQEDANREWAARLHTATTPGQQRKLAEAIAAEHADTQALLSYNLTDIASEAEASSRIPDLTPDEFRFWQDDQRINKRGVAIDLDSVHACIAIIEQAARRYGDELMSLSGCKPTEVAKLVGWLHGRGVHVDNLDEEAVEQALRWNLPPDARRALEIRAAMGSASVKKVFAMRNSALNGRLFDLYSYHAALTGRPTGNGVQPANLPKAGPNVYRCDSCGKYHGARTMTCQWCGVTTVRAPGKELEWNPEAMEDALVAISYRSLDYLETLFGNAMLTIAGCLRGLFIAKEGHELVSSDFTAIEGVVIACIAGEQWRVDAYANDEPMYLLSASRMYQVPVEEMLAYKKQHGSHHPLRQKGKGGELGLGFGGWINALRQFGVDGPDDELKDTILAWRKASPNLEWLWGGQTKGKADGVRQNAGAAGYVDRFDNTPEYFGLEGAAVLAVLAPGEWQHVLRMDGSHCGVSYIVRNDALYCRVPSGGLITYHRPRLVKSPQAWRGLSLSYERWNTNPKFGAIGWTRVDTYSGKLAENCIAAGTLVLTSRGWRPIEQVEPTDRVHDGVEFVDHAGSIYKQRQECVLIDGVRMTPDHEVLTDAGWRKAGEAPTPTRPALRDVDRALLSRGRTPEVVVRVRLPHAQDERPCRRSQGLSGGSDAELRLPNEGDAARGSDHAWDDRSSGVRGVAQHDRPLLSALASGVEELRRAGHHGLRSLARVVRELLGRHGADVLSGLAVGAQRQQPRLLAGELLVGDASDASPQPPHERCNRHACGADGDVGIGRAVRREQDDAALPDAQRSAAVCTSAPVYDIVNCGPRQRFVVLGDSGPFIVHNCVQRTARDIQMPAIHRCETSGYPVVMHTYDEIVSEVPVAFGSVEEMERLMTAPLPWTEGWPIKAAGGWRAKRYRKG